MRRLQQIGAGGVSLNFPRAARPKPPARGCGGVEQGRQPANHPQELPHNIKLGAFQKPFARAAGEARPASRRAERLCKTLVAADVPK